MNTKRRDFIAAGAALAVAPAFAQSGFPNRPVRLIVPNPPGGPTDIVGRLLADGMSKYLGQPLVVDNRSGASGLIGTAAVATAPPDGYTVLVTSRSNHVLAPLVQKSTQVNPQKDLASVGLALRAVGLLVSNSLAKFLSLKELLAYAKANPGKLNYGSAGVGATNHIAMEQFKTLAGVDITHIPYKGSGPLIVGLMGNEVQFALLDFSSAQAGLKGGQLVPLGQAASKRLPSMAEVPTLIETGLRDYDPSFWIGLAAPRATPADVVARLNAALSASLANTRLKAYAQANGWELVGGAPKVLDDTVARDYAEFPGLIKRLDIKRD